MATPLSHLAVPLARSHFLPWRVIKVSPLRPSALFSRRGLYVLRSEMRWVWMPCLVLRCLDWRCGDCLHDHQSHLPYS